MADACKIRSSREEKNIKNQDENCCVFNVISVFISLVTILADLATDILVFVEYCRDGYLDWALITLTFIVTPNILINIFSLRWFVIDKKINIHHWVTHGFLVGLLERYILFLYEVFSCKNLELVKSQKLLTQRNDLSLLHFLYVFTGTIPQIILQTYAIVMLNENYQTRVFSLTASIASVIWGCVTYIYSTTTFSSDSIDWTSLLLKLTWHFGTLIGRIAGIFLFSIIFGVWTLIPLGLHWSAMTFWIITQKTTFCPNKFEETLYNAVMGFVYCFCFINVKEGHTRYRLMMFYTLIVTQNLGSMLLYMLITDIERQKKAWSIAATICVIFGTLIGIAAMIVYYRYFHSKGPIPWRYVHEDVELNNKVGCDNTKTENEKSANLNNLRLFKNSNIPQVTNYEKRKDSNASQTGQPNESENADKKFLLDHWIARSGTPTFTSAPIGNISMDTSSIELYTIENTPQTVINRHDSLIIKPKKKICSPTELTLKLSSIENLESSIDEITSNVLNVQKRRGICSSDELRDDFNNLNLGASNIINQEFSKVKTDRSSELSHDTDGSNKKTSSDSIDMDLDLSFSDINSSDINTFNENIVQKLCLSALKNIKVGNQDADIENIQRIALDILKEMYTKKDRKKNGMNSGLFHVKRDLDTPTEILSVHDYENICAVNIAREAWGLRSWNGYCDIENWLHDGSVVRDRSRDTFTSESSEISSCLSQELKNAILSAPPFPKKPHTYSNVFVKVERNPDDYANTVMCQTSDDALLTKSYILENNKDPNHLEPIIEELDDLGDIDPSNKKHLNSESSLVATIDEIRKATVTNSPRNLYHRREHTWESPQFKTFNQSENNLKKALWKEPSKFDSSNTMDALTEKQIALDSSHAAKLDTQLKDMNIANCDNSYSNNVSNYPQNSTRREKSYNSLKTDHKKIVNQSNRLHDISNKDIDLLWQLVSENTSLPYNSTENFSLSRKTPSLQSLIQKDSSANTSASKSSNIKKSSRNRPRRKFSILREKFEPKLNSDEEILYNRSDNNLSKLCNSNNINQDRKQTTAEYGNENDGMCFPPENFSSSDQINSTSVDEFSSATKQIKEKRSIFMKQVLSPPKFNTKLRHKI
ncbi:putative uncharacterized protein DDB_G0282133 [Zerene cesonia]|uniref:putative uncharacterized protein DDB_G0282133 n=1 Tax=Zerene cesonia TaxID=33412 RepID=UPI0018E55A30|nr:putative uncharacterized protein DDB_G0282133 [Zerene cesonia]